MNEAVSDFFDRVARSPILVMTSTVDRKQPPLANPLLALQKAYPPFVFVTERNRYWNRDDWHRRWRTEQVRFGAGIVLTFADWNGDWYGGPTGDHIISAWTYCEILDLCRLKRPVLWYANEHPALWYFDRFTVESLPEMTSSRLARLIPNCDAEPFNPAITDAFAC
jgi:hypothetical protein